VVNDIMRAALVCGLLACAAAVEAQELEPRAFSPSPVGNDVRALGLWQIGRRHPVRSGPGHRQRAGRFVVATAGIGHTFGVAGRQARIMAVFPTAWGTVSGRVHDQPQHQDLTGLVDPRFKLSIGLVGAPALTLAEFARAPRRTAVGASVTVVPPWGQYTSKQLVNLGYNRWAVKPEIGVSRPVRRWTIDGSASVWLFTTNDSYYPAHAVKRQDPVIALQGHASYALPRRAWLAVDATWFAGGETRVNGVPNPDLQRNTRLGLTLSIPIVGQQSLKLAYSTGTTTRRGSDFNTLNATWQLVMF
jgi:outer membrane putative beta-barrel porin/alpha-amylase